MTQTTKMLINMRVKHTVSLRCCLKECRAEELPLSSARQKNPHLGKEIFRGWSQQFKGRAKVNYIELEMES